jgi:hypothetical protein
MNAALSMFPADKSFDPAILNGWKEISAELSCSVRTAQRWERELRLPVHRMRDGHRTPVFAFKEELRIWLIKGAARVQSANDMLEMKPVQQIITSIRKLLTHTSPNTACSHCRYAMQHIDCLFWLNETEHEWKISLPYCPRCEPELLRQSTRTTH